jgi:HAD superfamily hydrolase (TIGR01484 family)
MPEHRMPQPLETISSQLLDSIKVIFFDIDDTFSLEGKILPEAYAALWRLYRADIGVVPVTGRPAGWCDMIARMWPVHAIVGENGAFYQYMDFKQGKLVKKYIETPEVRSQNAAKLEKLRLEILRKFPDAKPPSDQGYREFDFAIDYCEDVPRWPEEKVQALIDFASDSGAMAKLSSVHVNIWFGKYNKLSCVRSVLAQIFSINLHSDKEKIIYIGDSPNDEPFFESLPLTIGVGNVKKFLNKMKYKPAYITSADGGLGFAEMADLCLQTRASGPAVK